MQNLPSAPVTGPLTDAERTYAIDALKSTQANLHQSLAGLSAGQLTYKPNADRWSIAECAEHVALVETGIFGSVRASMDRPADPDKRAQIRVSDVDVIKAVRSRAVTLPAPDPFVPTGRFADTAGSLQAFNEQRSASIEFVQSTQADFRTHYFRHIALGLLDAYQAVLVMASHVERHRKQIEEIKGSDGFPQ